MICLLAALAIFDGVRFDFRCGGDVVFDSVWAGLLALILSFGCRGRLMPRL
jgi:hypothetical protein